MRRASIRELDSVALTHDVAKHRLKAGDVGVVVLVYGDNEAFEVEFITRDGYTAALLMLTPEEVVQVDSPLREERPYGKTTLPHVRT